MCIVDEEKGLKWVERGKKVRVDGGKKHQVAQPEKAEGARKERMRFKGAEKWKI